MAPSVLMLTFFIASCVPTSLSSPPSLDLPSTTTDGLTITFNKIAVPVSLKNAKGDELIDPDGSCHIFCGFYIQPGNSSLPIERFDTVSTSSNGEYTLGISGSTKQIRFTIAGANNYLAVSFTSLEGFSFDRGGGLHFELAGVEKTSIAAIGLNYMVYDGRGQDPGGHATPQPHLWYEAVWENATTHSNPFGRFAIYEIIDDDTEDETLLDLWVDEGMAHPRHNGTWDRPAARAWLDGWIKHNFDLSTLAMVPRNESEWRMFFPYAKLMEAKILWFNFRVWRGDSIDSVSTKMFPDGLKGFKDFSDDAAVNGFGISSHRMSGGLYPTDPDYCVKPGNLDLDIWGTMSLVTAISANDTSLIVQPDAGAKIPTKTWGPSMSPDVYQLIKSWKVDTFSIGNEWLTFNFATPMPNGRWAVGITRTQGIAHAAGAQAIGYARGNVFFIPSSDSKLVETVAERYANFSNLVQFQDGSFDGAAWFTYLGDWGFRKFATLVYQNLDHPTPIRTSGSIVPTWIEYRFNSVRTALGGNYTTAPQGTSLFVGNVGRHTPSLETIESQLFGGLASNSRAFTLGQDLESTLDVFAQVGNAKEVLTLVRDVKRASAAMGNAQRQSMVEAVAYRNKVNKRRGLNALWRVEGNVFRKWVSTATAIYDFRYVPPPTGTVTPRFYTQSGESTVLVLPPDLQAGFTQARVTGRLLARFDPTSPQNVDLLQKMGLASAVQVFASNPTATESWDDSRLKTYKVDNLDLTQHQGIGMNVTGDGSGGTLVVRFMQGGAARDYAVPLDFNGTRWIEVPTGEQGPKVAKWGPVIATWPQMPYTSITSVAIGVGYLPAHGHSNVTVTHLQALQEICDTIVDPRITVGDFVAEVKGTLSSYDMFTLETTGVFTIYDRNWWVVSNYSMGVAFQPKSLELFKMEPASPTPSSPSLWLEVGVHGATDTVPNPYYNGSSTTTV
eukprot:m.121777 g.121777  ORF g.121777 m.121777 type:complete len:952 (+) comp28878_c0_seq1:127-2982(+)